MSGWAAGGWVVAAYVRLCASRSPNRPATAACRRPSQICAILGAPLRRRPSHRLAPAIIIVAPAIVVAPARFALVPASCHRPATAARRRLATVVPAAPAVIALPLLVAAARFAPATVASR